MPRGEKGFGVMDPKEQKKLASQGGKAAHEKGVAPSFSHKKAVLAGQKGGMSTAKNREHMRLIGSKGGKESHRRKRGDKSRGERENFPHSD